ncbi:aldo/keto reductase [Agromyces sp. CCNWLW203]|uniref:aldo/keto reductase n=1 Tax=Agromyces sp. CCNWLW203 TaxID=3112842 RepID=UPI002F9649CF
MSAPLPRRRLGSTTAWVSELGFGAASLGNLFRETSDDEARGAVDTAWRRGIRSFDTAPHYGLGLSESRLGAALAGRPREEFSLSTKVGRLLVPNPAPTGRDEGFAVPDDLMRQWDFTREGILRSLDSSLERLGVDRVDVVFAHDPDAYRDDAARQALETLVDLREQGVVAAVGVGTNSSEGLAGLIADGIIDVVMLAGRYTLLEQGGLDTVLEPAREAGASVIAVGVYNSGLLSAARPPADASYDYLPAPPELLARANRLADVCESFGVSLPEAALAFPLRHPAVAGVALGMRTAAQVDDNVARLAAVIPDEVWGALADAGLVDPRSIARAIEPRAPFERTHP